MGLGVRAGRCVRVAAITRGGFAARIPLLPRSDLAGQASAVGSAAVEAGILAGAGAPQAAGAVLQAASAGLQAQLAPGRGRRHGLLADLAEGALPWRWSG